jgi:pimeloyl-ACP methyl ester carboxylesterase
MRAVYLFTLFLAVALGHPNRACAEQIQAQLPSGLPVNAEFVAADPNNPAVLVLHGFLQTYDFLATRNIVNDLSAMNYTVLAPNLSLGVPNRKQSAQCSAPHAHTFGDDLNEMDFWVKWLRKKGYRRIVLVGHSWGSQHSLGYVLRYPDSPIMAIVAISLVRTHQNAAALKAQGTVANKRLKTSPKSLHVYKLGFCNKYMTTPKGYLSYSKWSDQHVLDALATLHERGFSVYVILGGQDKRIDADWEAAVRERVEKMMEIEGANHFFSSVSEFDLNDQLERLLPEIAH